MLTPQNLGPANNPREARALRALLQGAQRREQLDRITGSSNSPDVVMRLRAALDIEIPCFHIISIDRDGRRCRPGVYSLSDTDRVKVIHWLGDAG